MWKKIGMTAGKISLLLLLMITPTAGLWTPSVQAAYNFVGGGDGSPGNPYIILTANDMNGVRQNMNASYKLGTDIDLSGFANWEPIGQSVTDSFQGNFDGNFHTIRGLRIESLLYHIGLFGYVKSPSQSSNVLKNVRLEGINILLNPISMYVGGLAGMVENTRIEGVYVSGSITGGSDEVGGLVGVMEGQISNSESHVDISGPYLAVGGLLGISNGVSIEHSYATGNITLTSSDRPIGGLVGWSKRGDLTITNSYSLGNLSVRDSLAGGLVGDVSNLSSLSINTSYAAGNVNRTGNHAGGIIGKDSGSPSTTLENVYWNGTNQALYAIGGTNSRYGAVENAAELRSWNTYSGWDTDTWGINEGTSTPYLKHYVPEFRLDTPLKSNYGTSAPSHVFELTGIIRDGSVGEALDVHLSLHNAADATVTESVYSLQASGVPQKLNWSVSFNESEYPAGNYYLKVTATDTVPANERQWTYPFEIVDNTPPDAPVLDDPADGSLLNNATPTINGSAEPHSSVTIVIDGAALHTLTTPANGNWSWTVSSALSEGNHSLLAYATDAAVNTSANSPIRFFTIDTTIPDAPVLNNDPANGSLLNNATPTISGSADPHSSVTIVIDGSDARTVTAAPDGTWSWVVSPALSEGSHTVLVRATSPAGNTSANSPLRSFTIDTTIPGAPVLNNDPANGSLLNYATPTISGSADPHSSVTIVIDGSDARTVTAAPDGTWSWVVSPALSEGSHTVLVRTTSPAGNTSANSPIRSFTIDTTIPGAPVLNNDPADGSLLNNATPTISGSADPHSSVTIVIDGSDAHTVTAAPDGTWSWVVSLALSEGNHTVLVRATSPAGNTSVNTTLRTFTIDVLPPVITLHGEALMVIQSGADFIDPGAIAEDSLEGDVIVTVTGSVDNQTPGTYELVYNAQDRAGNVATPIIRTVRVDSRTPDSPYYVYVSNNANLRTLQIMSGSEIVELKPAFSAETANYELETSVNTLDIRAIADHDRASVTIGGDRLSASGSRTISLVEGSQQLDIQVTAENGATRTYHLTINYLGDATPLTPSSPQSCIFSDHVGHWAERSICEAAEFGIIMGDDMGMFYPQLAVTRIEFAAMLLRTLGYSADSHTDTVDFVDAARIPSLALETASNAVKLGILSGYPDGTLRPLQTVNRAEMATMIARAYAFDFKGNIVAPFTDDAALPTWAKSYIYTVAEHGIMNGREHQRFVADGLATRAEAAVALLRLRLVTR